ncbi:MAG TPA: aldo/keto reductase [Candidatus Limiplasma sp.]|nr:aldo/keto reductase [Candidatus Limiplasma sp.]HRX08344.1 aldo/keto reductase [Candidatus Limiplasma sp.]
MRSIQLGTSGLRIPTVAVGCMRINRLTAAEAETFVRTALDLGANFFDHADIYGGGECETIFAKAAGMTPAVRETMTLQSKCGIRPGIAFDFSKKHILDSVDGSLKRLNTDYLDVLLLHRPDTLVEPEEVAEAFGILQESGKVRHFGVSNQSPMQIQLLQRYVKQPLVANQLQLSITNATMITRGMHVNMLDDAAVDRDGGILDFCRLHDITIQPWSPFQYGFFGGVFLGSDKYPELNREIDALAAKYGVSNTTIVIAWLLRHPAKMQPVTGTMNVQRLKGCAKAADITLTREEWYALLLKAGNTLP